MMMRKFSKKYRVKFPRKDIEELQNWIAETPHMKNVRSDVEFLKFFLRGCNYSVSKSKTKLDLFFTARSLIPDWFGDWSIQDETFIKIVDAGIFLPLRGFDKDGRFSMLMRLGKVIPGEMSPENCWKLVIMMFNMVVEGNRQAQTKGMSVIIDLDNMNSSHAGFVNPNLIKKLLIVFQEAYPMENDLLIGLSCVRFLNMPKVLEKVVQLALSFLDKKYKKILKMQDKSNSTLVEDFGTDILPPEYGGTNQTCDELTTFWKDELPKHSSWFNEQSQYKTDESLRNGKSKLHYLISCSIM